MSAPRFFSIDLEYSLPLVSSLIAVVSYHWKGAKVEPALVHHASFMGVKSLDVVHMKTAMGGGALPPNSTVIGVRLEWRDGAKATHDGMYLANLSPAKVDEALRIFLGTAAKERTERGEMLWPGAHVVFNSLGNTFEGKLSNFSPPMFINESVSQSSEGNLVYIGAAPSASQRVGTLVKGADIEFLVDENAIRKLLET